MPYYRGRSYMRSYRGGRFKKRRGVPNMRKKVVRTAKRSAARPLMPNQMCRDLGNVYPSCLVLKCRQSWFGSMGDTAGALPAGTAANDKYYSCNFRCFPSNAAGAGGGTFSALSLLVTYGSSLTAIPPGLARVFNTAGATGVYQRCCVLSCKYVIKCALTRTINAENGLPCGRWMHLLHTRDSDGESAPDLKSQATADTTWCQPDVRRKFKDGTASQVYVVGAAAGSMNTRYPAHRFTWRHTLWPHKELDQPFENYISQDASFAVADNVPTNRASLELRGFGTGGNFFLPESVGVMNVELVYTLLLKDPFATVA